VDQPNVVYLHSHDTGRFVQPYGYQVPTPNIQRLADQGLLFREAFCAAPSCSGSRAALLTGEVPHSNGMMGLAHRGFRLNDYSRHLVPTLRAAGYWSGLVGEQHLSSDPAELGYDHVVDIATNHVEQVAPAAAQLLREGVREPFFLSVGFFETHREYFEPNSLRDLLYSAPLPNLPDTPEVRRDVASYKASARSLDQGVGSVLGALDEAGLDDRTLVILTTDHGLAFPGAKATLSDRGIGVLLIMRGPGGFQGGRVLDALVSHVDVYPTLCELAGAARPPWLQGTSMMPLVRRETAQINDAVFAELTYHAAYEPQRAVRTHRYKYVRRFGERLRPVLANVDDSPTKDLLVAAGWAETELPREALYDLLLDPQEGENLIGSPRTATVEAGLRERLETWMRDTGDPLLDGPVAPPPGAELNSPEQRSAAEPADHGHVLDPAGSVS
jgi:N-sulfoglucosamine sulfohydrolase